MNTHPNASFAAGILPLFDGGKTVLLGKEYRERYNDYFWMEFGGKKELGETLAQTAHREFLEETAETIPLPFSVVESADVKGLFVDFYNEKTNFFYRMYCVLVEGEKPDPSTFLENAKGKSDVEMEEYRYFPISELLCGTLLGTEYKIYPTSQTRIELLKSNQKILSLCR